MTIGEVKHSIVEKEMNGHEIVLFRTAGATVTSFKSKGKEYIFVRYEMTYYCGAHVVAHF